MLGVILEWIIKIDIYCFLFFLVFTILVLFNLILDEYLIKRHYLKYNEFQFHLKISDLFTDYND